MIRFVADENFGNRIIRGLWRLKPDLDIVRGQDLAIAGGMMIPFSNGQSTPSVCG